MTRRVACMSSREDSWLRESSGAQIQTLIGPGDGRKWYAGSLWREPRITIGTTGKLAREAALNAPS